MSTYTVRRGCEIFAPLAVAMQQRPGIRVRLIVNIARNAAQEPPEKVVSQFAGEFWSEHWPWKARPAVYYDPRSLSADKMISANLHAKCIAIDDEVSFVTSANFTEWAQERNIEAGVLIRDETFARNLRTQFEALIEAARLRLVPGCGC